MTLKPLDVVVGGLALGALGLGAYMILTTNKAGDESVNMPTKEGAANGVAAPKTKTSQQYGSQTVRPQDPVSTVLGLGMSIWQNHGDDIWGALSSTWSN